MKVRLEQLDASGLELRVGDAVQATLGAVSGLRGELVQDGTRLAIDRAAATRAEVSRLDLRFGTTTITADSPIAFDQLHGSFRNDGPGHLHSELRADRADGIRIRLGVGELVVSGRLVLTGARLRIDGARGAVFAETLELRELVVELPGTKLEIETLEGTHVAVEWSGSGVRVRAATASVGSAAAEAMLAPTAEEAPAAVAMEAPAENTPAAVAAEAPASAHAAGPRAFVEQLLPLLDGLAGQLDVDVGLDLTVPVLGRRRATHELRIPIEGGALDYRKLESNLAALEDSLLDFSVRDDGLVLERGIPLLPTRGKGKPILTWNVEGDDLALAREHRIRLAMLPQFRIAGDGEDSGSSESSVALRELSLRGLDARLRLAHDSPPPALPVRRIGELVVHGELHHAVHAPPRDGAASARIAEVEAGPMTIDTGPVTAAFSGATLEGGGVDAEFAGLHSRTVRAAVRGLKLVDLEIAPSPRAA